MSWYKITFSNFVDVLFYLIHRLIDEQILAIIDPYGSPSTLCHGSYAIGSQKAGHQSNSRTVCHLTSQLRPPSLSLLQGGADNTGGWLALLHRRNLLHGITLRQNFNQISFASFTARKNGLVAAYKRGEYLKDPDSVGKPAPNPMSDPAGMDQMMNMLKGNMAMIVPQTLIMGWINAFFSGFVISM